MAAHTNGFATSLWPCACPDLLHQIAHVVARAALQRLLAEQSEPAFHLVRPRRVCRREVQAVTRCRSKAETSGPPHACPPRRRNRYRLGRLAANRCPFPRDSRQRTRPTSGTDPRPTPGPCPAWRASPDRAVAAFRPDAACRCAGRRPTHVGPARRRVMPGVPARATGLAGERRNHPGPPHRMRRAGGSGPHSSRAARCATLYEGGAAQEWQPRPPRRRIAWIKASLSVTGKWRCSVDS